MTVKIIERLAVFVAALCAFQSTPIQAQTITEIIATVAETDIGTISGAGRTQDVIVDSSGNVYMSMSPANSYIHRVIRLASTGGSTRIIDEVGTSNFTKPTGMALDSLGNLYVAADNGLVFKITPDTGSGNTITQIIDATGDGTNALGDSYAVAVDNLDNVYVTGGQSHNVFKITPDTGSGSAITQIIDLNGDGTYDLRGTYDVVVDSSDNVYVTGYDSDNVFKITPDTGSGSTITQIIDSTGDGSGNNLDGANLIATDSSGNVYVTGYTSDNAFKITPDTGSGSTITQIIDSTGDGTNGLDLSWGIVVDDSTGNVYVGGASSNNVFMITPDTGSGSTITEIIDINGDGISGDLGQGLLSPHGLDIDSLGNVYVAASQTGYVFKIVLPNTVTIPATSYKVGDVVTATITVTSDTDDYTTGSGAITGTINGYTLGSLNKVNDSTYTATFTLTDNGSDVPASSDIPVNFTLTDSSGSIISTFTTPISQLGDALFANLPDVTLTANTNNLAEDGGVATLTATLIGSMNNQWPEAITVNLAYTGTATANTDYSKSNSIVINATSSIGTVTITGIDDAFYDAPIAETIIVDIDSLSVGNLGSPNSQTLTISDDDINLPVGVKPLSVNGSIITVALGVEFIQPIIGGQAPFSTSSPNSSIFDARFVGDELRILPIAEGSALIIIRDSLGQSAHFSINVVATTLPDNMPELDSKDPDSGNNSGAFSGGVSADARTTFFNGATFSVAEDIEILSVFSPEAEHIGEQAAIIIAVIDMAYNPEQLLLLGPDGQLIPFDGFTIVAFKEVTLLHTNTVDITGGVPVTLTQSLVGSYIVYIGYQLLSTGKLVYTSGPIEFEVIE